MAQARARSADRISSAPGTELSRLTDMLAQALTRQQTPRETFKAPEFDGSSNVEDFIQQFTDVADANEWTPGAALLHLRNRLKEEARECGQGQDVSEVFNSLRARFGMTGKEARTRLANLKKGPGMSLHGHATEVDRLCKIAYQGLPAGQRQEMAVEMFCSTLGNIQLQRHLLAVPTPNMETAVRAANDYLQAGNTTTSGVKTITPEETEAEGIHQATDPIQQLMSAVKELALEVAQLKQKTKKVPQKAQTEKTTPCYVCNKTGHWRKNCPVMKEALKFVQQGNGTSLQQ